MYGSTCTFIHVQVMLVSTCTRTEYIQHVIFNVLTRVQLYHFSEFTNFKQ